MDKPMLILVESVYRRPLSTVVSEIVRSYSLVATNLTPGDEELLVETLTDTTPVLLVRNKSVSAQWDYSELVCPREVVLNHVAEVARKLGWYCNGTMFVDESAMGDYDCLFGLKMVRVGQLARYLGELIN